MRDLLECFTPQPGKTVKIPRQSQWTQTCEFYANAFAAPGIAPLHGSSGPCLPTWGPRGSNETFKFVVCLDLAVAAATARCRKCEVHKKTVVGDLVPGPLRTPDPCSSRPNIVCLPADGTASCEGLRYECSRACLPNSAVRMMLARGPPTEDAMWDREDNTTPGSKSNSNPNFLHPKP
jgi:hypothetical protein